MYGALGGFIAKCLIIPTATKRTGLIKDEQKKFNIYKLDEHFFYILHNLEPG
jgi:hypothetical protein